MQTISKTETALVLFAPEADKKCSDRYTLTPDGEIRDLKGRRLGKNARIVRAAVYSAAKAEGFAFSIPTGVYY